MKSKTKNKLRDFKSKKKEQPKIKKKKNKVFLRNRDVSTCPKHWLDFLIHNWHVLLVKVSV